MSHETEGEHRARGRLIVFEGIDGSGKSTVAGRVNAALRSQGRATRPLREPTDGPYGRRLRSLMLAGREAVSPVEECALFLDDRREDVALNIAPALARGEIVIMDRYYFSTMAYQGALGLDPQQIRRDNEAFAPRPDLALYFDLEPRVAVDRIQRQRGEALNLFERVDYLERVRAIFCSLSFPFWRVIDAQRPLAQVVDEALRAVGHVLEPSAKP